MTRWLYVVLPFCFLWAPPVLAKEGKGFYGRVQALPSRISREARRLKHKIPDAVFHQIDSFNLFSEDFSGSRARVGVRLSRAVYSNNDVSNSHTVVDTIDTPLSINLLDVDYGELFGAPITFSLGVGGGVRIANIRQVRKGGLNEIPGEKETVERFAQEQNWYATLTDKEKLKSELSQEIADEEKSDLEAAFDKERGDRLAFLDALNYARFSKFFNILTHPRKLPLRAEWLKNMENGEVMTYTGYGTASFGPGIGWSIGIPGPAEALRIGAGFRTFISGHYQIAVLKEDERYSKVKINRGYMNGESFHIYADSERVNLIEEIAGAVAMGNQVGDILSVGARIVPFRFNTSHAFGKSFDIGYRFDMSDRRAREAYNRAVLGLFAEAEELYQLTQYEAAPPVQRIFERQVTHRQSATSQGAALTFLFDHQRDSLNTIDDMKITLPDGRHFLFKARTVHSERRRLLHFFEESRRYTFTTDYYINAAGKAESGMIVEGTIDDSSADGYEINRYSQEVEAVIGKDIFPPVPTEVPEEKKNEFRSHDEPGGPPQARRLNYDKAYYYFRLGFNERQLNKFIQTPTTKRWQILEEVYRTNPGQWSSGFSRALDCGIQFVLQLWNFPASFINLDVKAFNQCRVATRFQEIWANLQSAGDPRHKARLLDDLFRLPAFSLHYLSTIKRTLPREQVDFYVSAYSHPFGQITDQGETPVKSVDTISNTFGQAVDFDRPAPPQDLDLIVRSSTVNPQADGSFKMFFSSEYRPNYLFIRIEDDDGFRFNPVLLELAVFNKNHFNQGGNEVTIAKDSPLPFARQVAEVLRTDRRFKVSFAMSIDGKTWGPIVTTSVKRLDEQP